MVDSNGSTLGSPDRQSFPATGAGAAVARPFVASAKPIGRATSAQVRRAAPQANSPFSDTVFATNSVTTTRHRSAWIEAGPADGPLMIFLHGWPELGIVWRAQLDHFASAGWRCIAPDMRGYGGSSVPTTIDAYALREVVADMVELHDAVGGEPAVWVGHDFGSPVVWALASHHVARCRAVVNICIPYLARGFALPTFLPLIDRDIYPVDTYPVGQWDYWLNHRENFARTASQSEADVEATFAFFFRAGTPDGAGEPAPFASIRANGGFFGPSGRPTKMPRDTTMMNQTDFDTFVAAFRRTGLSGADSWYMNNDANLDYAREAPDFGRLTLPVLFLHAVWDTVCETVRSRLADPMRADCADLTEVSMEGGHTLMIERRDEVNIAIGEWLAAKMINEMRA